MQCVRLWSKKEYHMVWSLADRITSSLKDSIKYLEMNLLPTFNLTVKLYIIFKGKC